MLRSIVASSLILLTVFAVIAQPQSDRERAGLFGNVKSIREETAELVERNGRLVEGARRLESIKTYDISGKLLTHYNYTDEGEVLYGDTLFYDSNGRLIEKRTEHSKFVYLCDKKIYIYDDRGRMTEEHCYLTDRGLIGKTLSRYDERGRLIEEERFPIVEAKLYFSRHTLKRSEFDSDGRLIRITNLEKEGDTWLPAKGSWDRSQTTYLSTPETRGSTTISYGSKGEVTSVTVTFVDEHDNETESVTYLANGEVESGNRYVYIYDKQGNYVKKTDYEWSTDTKSFQLSEVTYRKIEYFSPTQVPSQRKATRQ